MKEIINGIEFTVIIGSPNGSVAQAQARAGQFKLMFLPEKKGYIWVDTASDTVGAAEKYPASKQVIDEFNKFVNTIRYADDQSRKDEAEFWRLHNL